MAKGHTDEKGRKTAGRSKVAKLMRDVRGLKKHEAAEHRSEHKKKGWK